jgi:hypothetical protein
MAAYKPAKAVIFGAGDATKFTGYRIKVTGRIPSASIWEPRQMPGKDLKMSLVPGMTGFLGYPEKPYRGHLLIAIIRVMDTPDLTLERLAMRPGSSTALRLNMPTFQENFAILIP